MSQVHKLSDQRVEEELRKMTAFIKQEALEKAREIEIKANEEFAIEKSRLVRQETDAIDAQYEKKFKQAAMSQRITRSTVANKARLRVLGARQEIIDELFAEAEKRLAEETKNEGKYGETLKGLVLQGFLALKEKEVQVRARKTDYELVGRAIKAAEQEYKQVTGQDVKGSIMEENPLPEESAGGVNILGSAGKIEVDSTLQTRLSLLQETALPAIRETIFGKNPNRRFND